MKSTRIVSFATAFMTAACASAVAQDFPVKQISMTMPFAAGGPGDAIARIVAQGMSDTLKQQVFVENIGGAGGTIGVARVAAANPDGYSILMMHIGHATNVALYPNLKYDAIKDFEPIGLVGEVPMVIVGKKALAADTLQGLVDRIKADKDSLTYAHAGIGSASHLCGLLFFSAIGAEVRQVPYRGTGPAMNDLLGGQVDFLCDQTVNTVPNAVAGTIKAFAVTTPKRLATLPAIPTADESGLKGFDLSIWYANYAPKGTPQPILDRLAAAHQAALASATVTEKLNGIGVVIASPQRATPAVLAAYLKSEIDKWGPIIRKAGVTGQ